MMVEKISPWRILIVFMFGFVHGMGFASALNETGLPLNKILSILVLMWVFGQVNSTVLTVLMHCFVTC